MIGALLRLVPVALAVYAVSEGRGRVAEMSGEVLAYVMQFKAGLEMRGMVDLLSMDQLDDKPLPRDFPRWLRENMKSDTDPALDPWKTPYKLEQTRRGGVFILSCGADQQCGTKDDVRATVKEEPGAEKDRWKKYR